MVKREQKVSLEAKTKGARKEGAGELNVGSFLPFAVELGLT